MTLLFIFSLQERDKLFLSRSIIFELVSALKFKLTLPDENLLLLVQVWSCTTNYRYWYTTNYRYWYTTNYRYWYTTYDLFFHTCLCITAFWYCCYSTTRWFLLLPCIISFPLWPHTTDYLLYWSTLQFIHLLYRTSIVQSSI